MGRQRTIQREAWEHAKRHEHELTPNQRRVLDLICEGKTNKQIGEALGMTLDGAKWNVSEALTKLGLATREEAAEYWRARKGWGHRAGQLVRGLLGVPLAAKVAAGGVALAVVAGAGLWALGLGTDETAFGSAVPLEPFILEARISVTQTDQVTGAPPSTETVHSTLRWWHADGDNSRWTITSDANVTWEAVYDGKAKTETVYRSDSNTYTIQPLSDLPDGIGFRPLPISFLVGPTGSATVDDFVERLRERQDFVEVMGEESFLGRKTVVIRHGPLYRGSSTETAADGTSQTVERTSGEARVWIDAERMMVLKEVGTSEASSYEIEVTRLEWGTWPGKGDLAFVRPSGATEGGTGPDSEVGKEVPSSAMPNVLTPTYLPGGAELVASGEGGDPGGSIWFTDWTFHSAKRGEWELEIHERYLGNGEGPELNGQVVLVRQNEARLVRELRGESHQWTSLRWIENSVLVELQGTGLPFEEFMKVANGTWVQP